MGTRAIQGGRQSSANAVDRIFRAANRILDLHTVFDSVVIRCPFIFNGVLLMDINEAVFACHKKVLIQNKDMLIKLMDI